MPADTEEEQPTKCTKLFYFYVNLFILIIIWIRWVKLLVLLYINLIQKKAI